MENNGILNINLVELLNILDARANISIFTEIGKPALYESIKVYELLNDKDFLANNRNTRVKGIVSFINNTNILI